MNSNVHIQYWEKSPPAMRDALIVLMNTLALLAKALPVALENIGSKGIETQEEFWRAFYEFDRETDLTVEIDTGDSRLSAMRKLIDDWADLAEARVTQPSGDLREETDDKDAEFSLNRPWKEIIDSSDMPDYLGSRVFSAIMSALEDNQVNPQVGQVSGLDICKLPTSSLRKKGNCGKKTIALIRRLFPEAV